MSTASELLEEVAQRFRAVAPPSDFWSLRLVHESHEVVSVRRNVVQPITTTEDFGVMITVRARGGVGYAATSDVSAAGLRQAAERAAEWARRAGDAPLIEGALSADPVVGEYQTPVAKHWASLPLGEKIDMVRGQCERLKGDDRIVDWDASLWHTESDNLLVTASGGHIRQRFNYLVPMLSATANSGAESQTRTFGGQAWCRQGGLEVLEQVGFHDAAPRIAGEAIELLLAPDCPSGAMDLLLAPDQMILQIHESIGHPLELDRILGDERNYAGTSFVTLDMFGTYRYGSPLLNVVFDPTRSGQFASYAFDDEGTPAQREDIIRDGVLLRPLGGASSQLRAGMPGVANARADGWNRPPIDRMANLNLEPGASRFEEMVAAVEQGVYMATNCSWSIDDSRNKFQFGCEWGRRIENGRFTTVVRKPNYRGCSATFWRSLAMVGDDATFEVFGTPFCGKGEPNQIMRVGHAAPACLFANVDVFGGAD